MPKPYDSARIFKRDWMEWFTHVHPLTPLIFWTPVVVLLLYRCFAILELGVGTVAFFGAVGLITWTFSEYVLHRFVFHYKARSEGGEFIVYLFHGNHHHDPIDPTRLVMPPIAALIIAAFLFPLYRLVFGPVYVEPFFAFYVIGYLCYDYIHYSVHHFTPRTRVGKYLKNNHMQHHFVAHGARWGVSSTLWDYVFGTIGDAKRGAATRSKQAR